MENQEQPLTVEEKIQLLIPQLDRRLMLEKIRGLLFKSEVEDDLVKPHVYQDLEMFTDHNNGDTNTVINKIDKTMSAFGRVCLEEMFKNPVDDTSVIKIRQDVIRSIVNSDLRPTLCSTLTEIKGCEDGILWFWEDVTDDLQSLYDMVYFNFGGIKEVCDFFNSSEEILTITTFYAILLSPIMSAIGPALTIVMPLILLKWNKPEIPVGTILYTILRGMLKVDILSQLPMKAKMVTLAGMLGWAAFYIYSVYTSYKNAYHIYKIVNIIHGKIRHIAKFIKTVKNLYYICEVMDLPLGDFAVEESLERLSHAFSNPVLDEECKLFNNKGCILNIYRRFILKKDMLLPLLAFVGQVDSYVSMANLYSNNKGMYCFVDFSNNEDVEFVAKDVWHPYLDVNSVVTNSISIDKDNRNVLVTGPNAAGKSTFIKAIALSVLFGQTYGIAPAKQLKMVPFNTINSYLNIPDCKGRESLFQAEMHRCKAHLDNLNSNHNMRSFVIMDEIFSSTNYKEGISAAYAVCKRLIEYPKSVSIITTHYTPLGTIEDETDGKITNYKFTADENEIGEMVFNYELEAGVSDQYIALKLLKLDGFDDEIINDAIQMCDRVSLNVDLLNDDNM